MKKIALATAVLAAALVIPACTPANDGGLRANYSKIYADISEEMLEVKHSEEIAPMALVPADDYGNVYSTGAYLYFVSELYKNEKFVISEKPVQFTCSYNHEVYESYTIVFSTVINKEEGKVIGEFNVGSLTPWNNEMEYSYLRIDVDYDFEKEEIIAFELFVCGWDNNDTGLYNLYKDGILYMSDYLDDEENAEINSRMVVHKQAFETAAQDIVVIDHDFTEEYTKSMEYLYEIDPEE